MSSLPYLDGGRIRLLVSIADTVHALETAFAAGPTHVERSALEVAGGDLLVMPAADDAVAGVKMVAVQPANAAVGAPVIQGIYVLFDMRAGSPVALLDGASLTSLRTPAVSALVTRRLARADARRCVVLGRGPQGLAHVEAMRWALGDDAEIVLLGRGDPMPFAADVVCTCTSSATPVITWADLAPGAHLNVVGSYKPDRREVPGEVVGAATVVVDGLAAARTEAGDLVLAATEGRWSWDSVAGDLSDVCTGRVVRRSDAELTLFKSVGLALEDLVVARLAAERAGLA